MAPATVFSVSVNEIDDRVGEAADDARHVAKVEGAISPPAPEPPPLELAVVAPSSRKRPEPLAAATEPHRVRRLFWRVARVVLILALVVLGAVAFVLFTHTGRALLPESLQTPAAKTAIGLEQRAREATGPTFYTFTDDNGVVQIVDDIEKVPDKYRKRVKISH